jgi:hypothetical protein
VGGGDGGSETEADRDQQTRGAAARHRISSSEVPVGAYQAVCHSYEEIRLENGTSPPATDCFPIVSTSQAASEPYDRSTARRSARLTRHSIRVGD